MTWHTTSSHSRGYGAEWRKVRELALRRDFGLCQCPDCKGRRLVANHVHHIVSKADAKRMGWTLAQMDALENLISLNKDCHDRMHGNKARAETGADGWPK